MAKILNSKVKNIPWQDKPENCNDPVWRYTENPIIDRSFVKDANSIFNSAVVRRDKEDDFAGVFRLDDITREQYLVTGFSKDGIHWKLNDEKIFRGYDPRLCEIDGKYYLSWVCHTDRGTSIGIAVTEDFINWARKENAVLPVSRNGVLFPRKVNNEYMIFTRPCDKGHTPYGDIFLSHSPDLTYWGKHRFVIKPENNWEMTKVGAGPTPIETDEGWLCFYHGVITSCNGFTYSMGAMITDINEPWKVLHRADCYLLSPRETYEFVGDVPNVVFPCAALADSDTGRIAVYYGGADTVVGLAFTTVDEVINFIKEHDMIK
ncbi:MAG: glycosidase [Ruminococcaceae bacterium]|nr:glycosidase [Oscillospiraceae bacterium]